MVIVNRTFSLWKLWNKWYMCSGRFFFNGLSEWVIIVYPQRSILSATSWREQVTFDEMLMMSALYYIRTFCWIFVVLAHWNNSRWVGMSLHWETLSWFRNKQSLFLPLKAACLAEKQQISILLNLVWHYRGSNARSITLLASIQSITPPMAWGERWLLVLLILVELLIDISGIVDQRCLNFHLIKTYLSTSFLYSYLISWIKTNISKLVHTTRFRNNIHHVS